MPYIALEICLAMAAVKDLGFKVSSSCCCWLPDLTGLSCYVQIV